jgi:hypothetical protein
VTLACAENRTNPKMSPSSRPEVSMLHSFVGGGAGPHSLHDNALLGSGSQVDHPVILVVETNFPGVRQSSHFKSVRERRAFAQLVYQIECCLAGSMVQLAEVSLGAFA